MTALPDTASTASVPLALMLDAQRRLLGVNSVAKLAEATWTVARQVADIGGVSIYQRRDEGLTLTHAVPEPRAGEEAALTRILHGRARAAVRSPLTCPGLVIAFVPPSREPRGAVVLEHGGGDQAALDAVVALAAQSLRLLLIRERGREQERRLLGQLLHDGVVQDLAYVSLQLDLLERTLPAGADDARRLNARLHEEVNAAIGGLRGTISTLRRAESPLPSSELPLGEPSIERAVLAIMREALTNVRKHANASRMSIELAEEHDELHVSVRDNGVGIGIEQAATVADGEHFGLEQMRELAGELGGTLAIGPAVDGGTVVDVRLPLHSSEWVW